MCLISVIACLKDPKECLFYIVDEFLKDIGDIWITFENIKWGNDNDHLPWKPEKPCPILKMSIVVFYCSYQKSKICSQLALMAFWISRQFTFSMHIQTSEVLCPHLLVGGFSISVLMSKRTILSYLFISVQCIQSIFNSYWK